MPKSRFSCYPTELADGCLRTGRFFPVMFADGRRNFIFSCHGFSVFCGSAKFIDDRYFIRCREIYFFFTCRIYGHTCRNRDLRCQFFQICIALLHKNGDCLFFLIDRHFGIFHFKSSDLQIRIFCFRFFCFRFFRLRLFRFGFLRL